MKTSELVLPPTPYDLTELTVEQRVARLTSASDRRDVAAIVFESYGLLVKLSVEVSRLTDQLGGYGSSMTHPAWLLRESYTLTADWCRLVYRAAILALDLCEVSGIEWPLTRGRTPLIADGLDLRVGERDPDHGVTFRLVTVEQLVATTYPGVTLFAGPR